jgi:flagellar biosynthesis protein FlhA
MTPLPQHTGLLRYFEALARHRHFLVPISFLLLIVVLIVPLPTAVMDILISANISLATVILLTTIYMARPLDFSVFPALLLATTLFRLVLNVASTRLILSAEADTPEQATAVAGHVIEAFGEFVAGQSPIVGMIIFVILVVVQFVVITKGATRMSEVAARFTLDAMPGKQMAIDADLSAGMIDEKEARQRRERISDEADFYGAMDGASKFVRGDAIAGIIITLVNIVGGFAIGWLEKGWTMTESIEVFTKLTIGDGLVSQIPSFIIAIAAGFIVARTSGQQTIGDAIPKQLASQPMAMFLIAGFLGFLSLTPLPTIPLLTAAGAIGALGWGTRAFRRQEKADADATELVEAQRRAEPEKPGVDDLLHVDTMEIEIGYALVPLVETSAGGDLLNRIALIRKQLAVELGIVVPPVRIRDNMQIDPNMYRVKLRGAVIGEGRIYPNLLMAMDSGLATGRLDGIGGREPAFGLDAIWIERDQKHRAETMNYTVVDGTSVMATHLTELIRGHADELLSRQELGHLVEQLKSRAPKLVEEAIPSLVKPGELQRVLQNLLRERVPVRDLELIIETLAEWVAHTRDLDVLTEYVRNALRRTISEQHAELGDDGAQRLFVVTLDPAVEDLINGYVERGPGGTSVSVPPRLASRLAESVSATAEPLVAAGHQLIVLTSPAVRAPVKQVLANYLPHVVVLAYNEVVKGLDVESMGLIQLQDAEARTVAHAGAA